MQNLGAQHASQHGLSTEQMSTWQAQQATYLQQWQQQHMQQAYAALMESQGGAGQPHSLFAPAPNAAIALQVATGQMAGGKGGKSGGGGSKRSAAPGGGGASKRRRKTPMTESDDEGPKFRSDSDSEGTSGPRAPPRLCPRPGARRVRCPLFHRRLGVRAAGAPPPPGLLARHGDPQPGRRQPPRPFRWPSGP